LDNDPAEEAQDFFSPAKETLNKSLALPAEATPNRPRVRETRYKGRGPEA